MKYAADFRAIAREALRGKWLIAVLTGFVASLIGAEIAGGGTNVFFGWSLLCALPTIIAASALLTGVGGLMFLPLVLLTVAGELFLHPYMEAAHAAFYRDVSGTEWQDRAVNGGETNGWAA